ncbi:MAG: ABC transporter permease [Anaerolinea sp.]|nr:ABC transporter permease [Anaerolinea sp.]
MDEKTQKPKNDVGKVVLQELTGGEAQAKSPRRRFWQPLVLPALAIFTGLLIGAVLIILTSEQVYAAFRQSFGAGLLAALQAVGKAYGALLQGSFGDPVRIVNALGSGDALEIRRAINPFLESLVAATPYIFAGLAVAVGFRAGLFNIGVEGQLFIGAAAATFVGYAVKGLPAYIHMPLAMLAGAVAGGFWGFIPGWLKAKTGGHEVINTIMLNWIAFRLTDWLLAGPMQRPNSGGMPISPMIEPTARIPQFFPAPIRFHLGFFIALAVAYFIYWLLFKTTWGFNLRTVGANPNGARYAGMNIVRTTVLGMTLSGALAGLAGANQVLAITRAMAMGLSSGYGFDSIALALLGNSTPLGVVLAALLFGFLRNGATNMMVVSRIPIDIISILQALILVFIAAPAIIRSIYRLRSVQAQEGGVFVRSWGGK